MFLKRCLVLAAGVLLFLAAFIVYSQIAHARMEGRFSDERKKFGVEGSTLTSTAPALAPAPPAPANPSFQTNALIGPVPPDTNAAPADTNAPAAPDTTPPTPAPAAGTPSTMNEPALGLASVFQLASYRPLAGMEAQVVTAATGQAASETTQNTGTSTPAAAPETNAAPATEAAPASTKGGSVIVLLYHQFKAPGVVISPKFQWTLNQDVFEAEMKYIHDNGYNVIPMADLMKFVHHQGTIPPRAVVITIDDGYKSAIVYAAPILKKYGYPWTYFIYPDFITVAEGSGAASWNDLLELQKEGIDIESHSMTHPNLKLHHQKVKGVWHNFTPDEYADWLKNETAGSKALLEQHLGRPVTLFAYPYGEYNQQVAAAAVAAGYDGIFTVADNPVHATTDPHSIGRYTITQSVVKNFPAYLRQGALGLASADPAPGATTSDPRPVITAVLGYPGTLDPKSIETTVRDIGIVRHDFDPQTNTLRMYLPRDLIASTVLVNVRVEDAATKQVMVANWHFNYEPTGSAIPAHAPIAPAPESKPGPAATNAPEATEPDLEKNAAGTPMDRSPTTPAPTGTN